MPELFPEIPSRTLIVGLAVALGLLLLIWRFFFRLLKHILIATVIGILVAFIWFQMMPSAPVNPNIGKKAYSNATGKFVGTVVGAAHDREMGEVWIVEPPGGYKTKYRRSSLTLRDR
jgi:hypothetical protein